MSVYTFGSIHGGVVRSGSRLVAVLAGRHGIIYSGTRTCCHCVWHHSCCCFVFDVAAAGAAAAAAAAAAVFWMLHALYVSTCVLLSVVCSACAAHCMAENHNVSCDASSQALPLSPLLRSHFNIPQWLMPALCVPHTGWRSACGGPRALWVQVAREQLPPARYRARGMGPAGISNLPVSAMLQHVQSAVNHLHIQLGASSFSRRLMPDVVIYYQYLRVSGLGTLRACSLINFLPDCHAYVSVVRPDS
jgi:hypothetical protein